MGNGGRKLKTPKKPGRVEKVELFEYMIDIGGKRYALQTANPLHLEALASKKGSKAEVTGEDFVKALTAYNVNLLMPGIENFGRVYEVSEREWEGKMYEEREPVFGGMKKMMELLSEWKSTASVSIEFKGKEKVPKSDLLASNEVVNEFTGKARKA